MRIMLRKSLAVLAAALSLFAAGTASAGPGDPLGPAFVLDAPAGWQALVASDLSGNFVVASQAPGPSIGLRRYYADGTPQAPVASLPLAGQLYGTPAVAMNPAGDYVISWTAGAQSRYHIYAQAFRADGSARTPLLTVDQVRQNNARSDVAMAPDGRFVVVWNDPKLISIPLNIYDIRPLGGNTGIYAKRFGADGTPGAGNILVGLSVTNPALFNGFSTENGPVTAMDAQGGFVVVWDDISALQRRVINHRRYLPSGLPAGLQARVSSVTGFDAWRPAVAMNAAGEYMVVWHGEFTANPAYPDGKEVWRRSFSPSGSAHGPQARISSLGFHDGYSAEVAMDSDGDATVVWSHFPLPCCSLRELRMESFAADRSPRNETPVVVAALEEINDGKAPVVTTDGYGNVLVLWNDWRGIRARRYQAY